MAGQPLLIGVTGAIGAGKSSVLQAFALRGCACLSADAVVHTLYHQSRVRDAVVTRFGEQILDPTGEVDRVSLARVVFDDPNALAWLEEYLHPLVDAHMRTWLAEAQLREPPPPLVVYESPLLFEAGLTGRFDRGPGGVARWARKTRRARVAPVDDRATSSRGRRRDR